MELRLQERTSLWTGRQEQKQLPSFFEWQGIVRYTVRSSWTSASSTMMGAATRLYLTRILTCVGIVALLGISAFSFQHLMSQRAKSARIALLVDNLWSTQIEHVPEILAALEPDRVAWIDRAREVAENTKSSETARIRAKLTLSETDDRYVPSLVDRLLECDANEHAVLRNILKNRHQKLIDATWSKISTGETTTAQRIRAAVLLAQFSPDDERWDWFSQQLADALVRSEPFQVQAWLSGIKPARHKLLLHLSKICLAGTANSTGSSHCGVQ